MRRQLRWGAIIGEIAHGLRSALDNLVCQLVILQGGEADREHSFPVRSKEPAEGFAVEMRCQWKDRRGRTRHGPLFGVSDEATTIIEACQPYKGGHALLLGWLHDLWNLDKHQNLAPVHVVAPPPAVAPGGLEIVAREDRFERGAYIVEVSVAPQAEVEVRPQAPTDVTLGESTPVILQLRESAKLIHVHVLGPLGDLFPGETGGPAFP